MANHRHQRLLPDPLFGQHLMEIIHVPDGFATKSHDDIAFSDAVRKVLEKEGKVNVRQSRGDAYSGFHEEVANEGGEKYAPRTRAAEQAVANLLGQGGGAAGALNRPASWYWMPASR